MRTEFKVAEPMCTRPSLFEVDTSAQLPIDLSGDFWLLLKTDVSDNVSEFLFEDNNVMRVEQALTVLPTPSADLAVSALSVSPTTALPGAAIEVAWTVTNLGDGPTGDGTPGGAVSAWVDRIFISANATVGDADDIPIGELPRVGSLAGADGYDATATVTIPATVAAGSYTLAVIADATGAVYQRDDIGANQAMAALTVEQPVLRFADLVVTSVEAPATAIAGNTITLRWTVENTLDAGDPTPVGSWYDDLILSGDQTLGNADDRVLASVPHSGALNRGESYAATEEIRIPGDVSGPLYLLVVADGRGQVHEQLFVGNNGSVARALGVDTTPLVADPR